MGMDVGQYLSDDYGWLAWIVIGLIAGLIARAITPGRDPSGCIVTVLLGIGGARARRLPRPACLWELAYRRAAQGRGLPRRDRRRDPDPDRLPDLRFASRR